MLKLENVTAGYGDAVVLHGISLELPEHGSLAVLGRNGVGKSTLLLTIMGYTQIARRPRDLARAGYFAAWRRTAARSNGIGWVAQEREIFPSLSVEENLTVAARPGPGISTPCSGCFRGLPNAGATWAISCPAANSRCWRSRAR